MAGLTYFAIGDVHGEARKLDELHGAILDRIAFEGGPARIVHLGDYVDRGPDTKGVIERVMALEARFRNDPVISVLSLKGNHEQMLLDAYDGGSDEGGWWAQGGSEAADSYAGGSGRGGVDWRETIPAEHITWMRGLETIHHDTDRRLVFVHAGIEPATFPGEALETYLWTRSPRFFNDETWPDRDILQGLTVIHGHTPRSFQPEVKVRRINVDTGACFGGPLTAVMLKEGEAPQFLRGT